MALAIGDEAPNFDLSSTEGVLLMLRDEVIRTAQLLYLFADAGSDRVQGDLEALNRSLDALAELRCRVLAVSPTPLKELATLQVERQLLFPLLHDDRNFSAAYGVAAEEGKPAAPALFLVSRTQRLLWLANPVGNAEEAISQVLKLLKSQPSPTASYPKSVINRLVDRWVN
ncbi:MAG TPA: redoxin domain-containing protein [Thermoanaerobaculia bacterium]|nr:redoxin domain-containing protein [Thermoanaerobaculia bacterium]